VRVTLSSLLAEWGVVAGNEPGSQDGRVGPQTDLEADGSPLGDQLPHGLHLHGPVEVGVDDCPETDVDESVGKVVDDLVQGLIPGPATTAVGLGAWLTL